MKVEIEVLPFTVPNYVIAVGKVGKREDGFVETPKFHLSELSVETLDELCKQFRSDVFIKAGKVAP